MIAYVRSDEGDYTPVKVTRVRLQHEESRGPVPCWCPECQSKDRMLIARQQRKPLTTEGDRDHGC